MPLPITEAHGQSRPCRKGGKHRRQRRAQKENAKERGCELGAQPEQQRRRFAPAPLKELVNSNDSTDSTNHNEGDWWKTPTTPMKQPAAPATPSTRAGTPSASSPARGSKLAAFLRDDFSEKRSIDNVVHDLVDDVVATMRAQEKKHPVDLAKLTGNVSIDHRRKIVAWFVQAFHVVCFDDSILYGVVQLADRYLAACDKMITGMDLQTVVMACLCTTLKLETSDFLPYNIADLLAHITHRIIALPRVVAVEREVLTALNFCATSPNIAHFLDVFTLRITKMCQSSDWQGCELGPPIETVVGQPSGPKPWFLLLAEFLCQLSIINEQLATKPPSLMAASSLLLSLHALHAPSELLAVLLEDLSLVWDISVLDHRAEVGTCIQMMLDEWTAPCDASAGMQVVDKFKKRGLEELDCFLVPAMVTCPKFTTACA